MATPDDNPDLAPQPPTSEGPALDGPPPRQATPPALETGPGGEPAEGASPSADPAPSGAEVRHAAEWVDLTPLRRPAQAATDPPRVQTKRREDRWAHRRGEPRMFAFLWTMYLLVATVLAFAYVGPTGTITVEAYRPVARGLVLSGVLGVCVLWPMVRLSQLTPRGDSRWWTIKDWLVVVLPLQAVVLPQSFLAGWPLERLLALSGVIGGWGLVVSGLLWAALNGAPSAGRRAAWMAMMIVLVVAGPVSGWVVGQWPVVGRALWPTSAAYLFTSQRDWVPPWTGVSREEWLGVGLSYAAAALAWTGAVLIRLRGEAVPRGIH